MVKNLACRSCKTLTTGKTCPNCKSKDLSPEWMGMVIIFDAEKSEIAKKLNVKKPGKYALKVN